MVKVEVSNVRYFYVDLGFVVVFINLRKKNYHPHAACSDKVCLKLFYHNCLNKRGKCFRQVDLGCMWTIRFYFLPCSEQLPRGTTQKLDIYSKQVSGGNIWIVPWPELGFRGTFTIRPVLVERAQPRWGGGRGRRLIAGPEFGAF